MAGLLSTHLKYALETFEKPRHMFPFQIKHWSLNSNCCNIIRLHQVAFFFFKGLLVSTTYGDNLIIQDKTFCYKMTIVWVAPRPLAGRVYLRDLLPTDLGRMCIYMDTFRVQADISKPRE